MKFWKLFLYILFLIYPSESSTILRLYICKDIDGTGYLLTDVRVQCYTDTWHIYTLASIPLILLYPVGIPVFFYTLLRTNRNQLHDKRIQAQLGFLYAGYTAECWWFELADTVHKLFVTSILAFFPRVAQLPIGMVAVILYTCLILVRNPYLRKSDDTFHLICQIEIFLLLIVGYIFASLPLGSAYSGSDDALISAALIGITMLVFLGFLFTVIKLSHGWITARWTKYVTRRTKLNAQKEAREAKLATKAAAAAGDKEDPEAPPAKGKTAWKNDESRSSSGSVESSVSSSASGSRSSNSSSGSGSGSESDSDSSVSGSGSNGSSSESGSHMAVPPRSAPSAAARAGAAPGRPAPGRMKLAPLQKV